MLLGVARENSEGEAAGVEAVTLGATGFEEAAPWSSTADIAGGAQSTSTPQQQQQQPNLDTAPLILPLVLLNAVTVLWGTQHAVIKLILQSDLSPGMTNLARFGLAALLFSPWTPGVLEHPPTLPFSPDEPLALDRAEEGEGEGVNLATTGAAETWRAGTELGLWMFLGFAFQAIGLGFTTAR